MQDSCEAGDDSVLDLVDYCHRKLTLLASKATREGATTHDQQKLMQKAAVSTMEVRQCEILVLSVRLLTFISPKLISHIVLSSR